VTTITLVTAPEIPKGGTATPRYGQWWYFLLTGGQSMHAGGAMLLAENRVAPHIIQSIRLWASSAWLIYIHKHLVLLQAMLHA